MTYKKSKENIHILTPATQTATVSFARDLLARCEAGEVTAITVLEEQPGGLYQIHTSDSANRLHTAGALLEAAIARLGYE